MSGNLKKRGELVEIKQPVIEYSFLQYTFFEKKRYEIILKECLNNSKIIRKIHKEEFEIIESQSNGECDVASGNYMIDFKLMISQSLAEFQAKTEQRLVEVEGGYIISGGTYDIREVVLLVNACREMTEGKLSDYRNVKNKLNNEVVNFFDNILQKKKNIMLLFPAWVATCNKSYDEEEQLRVIQNEFATTLQYIGEYRNTKCKGYDTYFSYIVNIPQKSKFYLVINKFTKDGLAYMDKVNVFSSKTAIELAENLFI